MPSYRRWRIEGGVYFFTLVTHERRPILTADLSRAILRKAFIDARKRLAFVLDAIVLLPEHLHMLMRLPDKDDRFSVRVSKIKRNFTEAYLEMGGTEGRCTPGRRRQRYRGVWEKRFYEHWIRDHRDFKLHLDYIHVNPVKHGLVQWPRDWPWSTFHRYVKLGEYDLDWCGHVEFPGGVDIEPDTW
jgi:putative transposase